MTTSDDLTREDRRNGMVKCFGIIYGLNTKELQAVVGRQMIARPRCPKGKCERCYDVGRDTPMSCVAIPSATSKAKRTFRTCEACSITLASQWNYVILRVISGGRTAS